MSRSLAFARNLALLTPAALLGGAYISQYGFGLPPCEMCWWQRWAHFAALVPAISAFLAKDAQKQTILVWLAAICIAVSALVGGFHAGVEYGWWEGLTRCSTEMMAGGDPLEAIMGTPIVRCDVAPWSLFGISLAGWNFLISGASAIAIAILSAPAATRRVEPA